LAAKILAVRYNYLIFNNNYGKIGPGGKSRKIPTRKDKAMRSLLAVLLSITLFVSTMVALAGPQNPSTTGSPAATPLRPQGPTVPSALYECDGDQCENPHSGGAVWLFAGDQGQGMWLYQAVTKLTVVSFDGRSIHIHRADPVGTYSSQFVNGAEFFADYFGTITGDRIEGQVYWNGAPQPGVWHATIVNEDFCTARAGTCPLHPDQLSVLGRRASEAGMYPAAFRCFQIAAGEGDPDGEGFEATMMMNGWGGKQSPSEVMALLQESADHDSYPGERGLARAYSEGVIVPKNPERAAHWNQMADGRQARLEAEEKSRANAQLAGKVLPEMAVFLLLVAVMAGGNHGTASSYDEEQERMRRFYQEGVRNDIQNRRIEQMENPPR
jgi:hypothetical protein